MKTAICISGIGRSIDYTFDNLKNNLIDCWNDRDIFYVLGKSEYSDKVIKLFEKVERCNLKLYDQKDIDIGNITMRHLTTDKITKPTPQSISKFMDKRVELGNLLESSNKKYDMVIVRQSCLVESCADSAHVPVQILDHGIVTGQFTAQNRVDLIHGPLLLVWS